MGFISAGGSVTGGGGAAQTPWTSNIDAATYNLNNAGAVNATTLTAGSTAGIHCAMQSAGVVMNAAAGIRWRVRITGAESGSNSGSDYQMQRFGDAGIVLSTPLVIARQTGNVGIGKAPGAFALDVQGDVNITGTYRVNGVLMATEALVRELDSRLKAAEAAIASLVRPKK